MEQKKETDESKKSQQSVEPLTPPKTENVNKVTEKENTTTETHETKEVGKEPIEITVFSEKKYDRQPTIANIIAGLSVVVSALLFYYTYMLFTQTKISTDAAVEAVKEQKSNDSLNQLAQRRKDSTDSIDREITIASITNSDSISKATLQTQINSLEETQKQYNIETRPFIQVSDIKFDTLEAGKTIRVAYSIMNKGKLPARFMTVTSQVILTQQPKFNSFQYLKNPIAEINSYISQNDVVGFNVEGPPITNIQYQQMKEGNLFAYVLGRLEYTNIATTEKRMYKFNIRLSMNPVFGFVVITNEDTKE